MLAGVQLTCATTTSAIIHSQSMLHNKVRIEDLVGWLVGKELEGVLVKRVSMCVGGAHKAGFYLIDCKIQQVCIGHIPIILFWCRTGGTGWSRHGSSSTKRVARCTVPWRRSSRL